mmetsp:Transcript_99674/g.287755  ORF Transcript_99674/g.287755 Transcript_99674/m.287755 type:complete len:272 (-) Transcript_99674:198-1013(-)
MRQIDGESRIVGVGRPVPDRPRAAGQRRVPDVAPGEGPRAAGDVVDGPFHAGGVPLQDAVLLPVRRPPLEQEGLQRVDPADVALLGPSDADLQWPDRRQLRRVVAKAEALPDEHDVEPRVRVALVGVVELRYEVVRVVQRHEPVVDPPRQLPWQLLRLPPRRHHVPQVAAVQAHLRLLVLPLARAHREGVRKHDTRRHPLGLHVGLRVVGAAVCGRQQANCALRFAATRQHVEDVVRGVGHHVRVGTEQLRAVWRAAPVRQLPLSSGADRA